MKYTCNNTVFELEDVLAKRADVQREIDMYIRNKPTLTPSKWAHFKRRNWTGVQKASFIYHVTNHPEYINPQLSNLK